MRLERASGCKVNLLLNILGKRLDGFHELETVLHPVGLCDNLDFETRANPGIELTCSDDSLAVDQTNLVHRAATGFLSKANLNAGVRIHLEKRIPLAAGLGGGSSNAANTLLGLNELFGGPLTPSDLTEIATSLGSDIPFFLQSGPALATGRGEHIVPLPFFPALRGSFVLLIYPGFGIATAWAYQQLTRFPEALHGEPGRAEKLISLLQSSDLAGAGKAFYNSLEAPALHKYPLLALFQEFLREHGAPATLMSGSGSTSFALVSGESAAQTLAEEFEKKFSPACWTSIVAL
jgi:4-diphosphocytidyl-2-C-methyl-D-erythritol kinase